MRRELHRLVETVADKAGSSVVSAAIKRRGVRQDELELELAGLEQCAQLPMSEVGQLEDLSWQKALDLQELVRTDLHSGAAW